MPHPTLTSQALYSVPTLSEELQVLGYLPGAPGYGELKHKFGSQVGTATPHVRTIQKLFRGDLIKYALCDGVIRLLNLARQDKGMPLLDLSLIEENEFRIDGLTAALGRAKKATKRSQSVLRKELAREVDCHSGLIRYLERGHRTTRERCERVCAAVQQLYGESCSVSNQPPIIRVGANGARPKRQVLAVIPKKLLS